MNVHFVRHDANARSVDENFVGLAAIDNFRIAGDELDAGVIGCGMHRLHHAPEILHRQSFLQNETRRQIERTRAAHCQVVNGSMNREFADVAAREKDRAHDKRIGAECHPFAVQRKNAPSCNGSSSSFRNCGKTIFSMSWWLSLPPLPWARTICL